MQVFYELKDINLAATRGDSLSFGAHIHNHLELVFMLNGCSRAYVDGTDYAIHANDAFIVFPNQIHMYEKLGEEDYFIFIFPPLMCPEYQYLFSNATPSSAIIENALSNPDMLHAAHQIIALQKSDSPYKETITKGFLLIILGNLFEKMNFSPIQKSDTDLIKKILLYCSENYTKDIQLQTVAKALHIHKCYVSYLFQKKLKIGFNDYINMLRISDACVQLMSENDSITDISYRCGFSSPRSFNRAFLRYTESTPREYRNNRSGVGSLKPLNANVTF